MPSVPDNLAAFFKSHPHVAIAFSGGVDSTYLAYAARSCAVRMKGYHVQTAFQTTAELAEAEHLAKAIGFDLDILQLDVLADETIAANPPNRCYHCKRRLMAAIRKRADADGFPVLLDATLASDSESDRPGMAALRELSVLSPLRLCGLRKPELRRLSREAGLPNWDKPANACLATRIPAGRALTERLLRRTEMAESFLAGLGFSDFRVRTLGEQAKLQLRESQFPLLLQHRQAIIARLIQDYEAVLLDLEPRDVQ